jgi:hypothetical protein
MNDEDSSEFGAQRIRKVVIDKRKKSTPQAGLTALTALFYYLNNGSTAQRSTVSETAELKKSANDVFDKARGTRITKVLNIIKWLANGAEIGVYK